MTGQLAPETPAALLERAACHLEQLAAAATPGPWRRHDCYLNHGGHTASVLAGQGNDTRLIAWLPSMSGEYWDEARNVWNNAAWAATMHPAVAAPLVAWLRETGEQLQTEPVQSSDQEYALALARAVLGEPDEEGAA